MTSTAKSQGPLFTRRALFTLIWPLLLEQTLSVTMGMADTLMVAGVGEAAVSSVSLVDSLNILIIQILTSMMKIFKNIGEKESCTLYRV